MSRIAKAAILTIAAGTALAGTAGIAAADAGPSAKGFALNSPGTGSGNNVQTVVNTPVNACETSVAGVEGAFNKIFGATCLNNVEIHGKKDHKHKKHHKHG